MTSDQHAPPIKESPGEGRPKPVTALVSLFIFWGVFDWMVSIFLVYRMFSDAITPLRLADTIFNAFFGLVMFACSWILSRGRLLVLYVFSAAILLSMAFSFYVGRGFDVIIAILGVYMIWKLIGLKNSGEIR